MRVSLSTTASAAMLSCALSTVTVACSVLMVRSNVRRCNKQSVVVVAVCSNFSSELRFLLIEHLPLNHAFNRTRRYGPSIARTPVAARRLTHALRLSVKYFLQSPRLNSVAASRGV